MYPSVIKIGSGNCSEKCSVAQPRMVRRSCVVLSSLILGSFSLFAIPKILCLFQLVFFWSKRNIIYMITTQNVRNVHTILVTTKRKDETLEEN